MANELAITFPTAATVYAIIYRTADGYVWNGSDFVVFANADIADYDVPLTNLGGDFYAAGFPSGVTADTTCTVVYHKQAGATPATTDLLLDSKTKVWIGDTDTSSTWGTGTSTTYSSVADADTYFNRQLDSNTTDWRSASDADKLKALTMATQAIENLNFVGEKADEDQDLEFPRGDDTTVPGAINEACCEIALKFLEGVDLEQEMETLLTVAESAPGVKVTYNRKTVPMHIVSGIPSVKAWRLLLPWLHSVSTVQISRV